MPTRSVFEDLIDPRILHIIRILLKKGELFHLHKLSSNTNIPIATLSRIIPKLTKMQIVNQIKIGKTKLYQIEDNKKTKELRYIIR